MNRHSVTFARPECQATQTSMPERSLDLGKGLGKGIGLEIGAELTGDLGKGKDSPDPLSA